MTVSVIVPAYNCGRYIEQTLHSLCAQTESDIEIVVVDDGSSDNTLSLAQSVAALDQRVRVFTQSNSGRPAVARNRGLRESCGEFVAFLDADDLYHPEKIKLQLGVLARHPEVDIVFSDVVQFTVDPYAPDNECYLRDRAFLKIGQKYLQPSTDDDVFLASDNFYGFMSTQITSLCTPSVLIRREALQSEQIWFPEDFVVGEDIDLWYRLAMRVKIAYLNRPLSYYRHHSGGITKNEEKNLRGSIAARIANLQRGQKVLDSEELALLRRTLARQLFSLAYCRFLATDMKEARSLYLRSREYDSSVFSRLVYAKTFLPPMLVRMLWRKGLN